MWPGHHCIYETHNGVKIYVSKGGKSAHNFKVRYREPHKRIRTPKHIHLIIDLLMKKTGNRPLTLQLVNHIIDAIILQVGPSVSNPPCLQIFSPDHITRFQALDVYGEYSVEFLLVITEMIMIQEKTNYPDGLMNLRLFELIRDEADIFSIVSAATFRGRR